MGKVLTLPVRQADIERLAHYSERVPDFSARLYLWRQRDAERREDLRRDISFMCSLAAAGLLRRDDKEGA